MRILGAGFQQNILNASVVKRILNPLQIFPNGELKLWLDPSDLSTLYQDYTGLIPVTADGDPAGLMLDKSQGLELGPELVTNGTFDTDLNGWINQDDWWSVVGGRAYHAPTASFEGLELTSPSPNRCNLALDYELVQGRLGIVRGSNTVIFSTESVGSGTVSLSVPMNERIRFARLDGFLTEFYIDNVSVREIPGNHAIESVDASRPVYDTDGALHSIKYDLVDDSMTSTLPAMPTATVAIMTDEGLSINYPVNISAGSYDIEPTSALGIEYGRVIVDRELTASEAAKLTAYFNKLGGV